MQYELELWGKYALRSAIERFMRHNTDGLAQGTIVDYWERSDWLMAELGEGRDIRTISFLLLERLKQRARDVLCHRNVTIKKRFDHLRRVMRFAKACGLDVDVPEKSRLPYDGRHIETLHTVEQWRVFRGFVPPGKFRKLYDLAFWTLQHVPDILAMERRHLEVDRPFYREDGSLATVGGYWRVNTKNRKRRVKPLWFPMEPEFRGLVPELFEDVPARPEALIIGPLWNVRRALDTAFDRATAAGHDIPRPTPNDLRRSGASMLIGRGHLSEYVRVALGHVGELPANLATASGRLAQRPNTATRHYYRPTPALLTSGFRTSETPEDPPTPTTGP